MDGYSVDAMHSLARRIRDLNDNMDIIIESNHELKRYNQLKMIEMQLQLAMITKEQAKAALKELLPKEETKQNRRSFF